MWLNIIRCDTKPTAHRVQRAAIGTMVDYELDELRREFLSEANDKVREIESQLDGDRSRKSLDRLTYLAHQLKGSGGSYGFERISTDAAELEKAVERIAQGEPAGRLEQQIQQHVVNLRAEIDKRSRELTAASR
jgi:HPt (histidine-containing phosphotransfer) domain-containing protein